MGSWRAQRGRCLAWYETHHPSVPHAEARHQSSALKIGELLVVGTLDHSGSCGYTAPANYDPMIAAYARPGAALSRRAFAASLCKPRVWHVPLWRVGRPARPAFGCGKSNSGVDFRPMFSKLNAPARLRPDTETVQKPLPKNGPAVPPPQAKVSPGQYLKAVRERLQIGM